MNDDGAGRRRSRWANAPTGGGAKKRVGGNQLTGTWPREQGLGVGRGAGVGMAVGWGYSTTYTDPEAGEGFKCRCRDGVWFGFVRSALLLADGTCVVLSFEAMPGLCCFVRVTHLIQHN